MSVSAATPAELEGALALLQASTGQIALATLYPEHGGYDVHDRHVLTPAVTVRLAGSARAEVVASAVGAIDYALPEYAPGFAVLRMETSFGALRAAGKLAGSPDAAYAEPQLAVLQTKRAMPNDPLVPEQWHLKYTGQAGAVAGTDINVETAWGYGATSAGVRGRGIRIGIVDDGLQTAHPDFLVDASLGYDWNQGDTDPNPVSIQDNHGTACAGDAAAVGNNNRGVSGSAPEATLVGLRLIGDPSTDQQEAEAMDYEREKIPVKSNSWGPSDTGNILEGPGPLTTAALANAAKTGRGGKGTIFLWAGGNGLGRQDNSNYDGYANSIYTLAVGALDSSGRQSSYSEPGANLVVCAPSDGATDALGKTTVDRTGRDGYNNGSNPGNLDDPDYTNDFGGTSSATPTVAGVVALMLEANPNLGWRDVQEILMRSARKVNPGDSDWVTNAGGIAHNHKHGAGLVDASAAVALARTWTSLPVQQTSALPASGLPLSIPDDNATGVSRTFDFSASFLRVEHVTVTLTVSNIPKGQLEVTLTSPSGTVSRLCEVHNDRFNTLDNWTFMTVRHWGESSNGVWTLKVADRTAGTTGAITAATVTAYGSPDVRPTIVVTPADLTFSADLGTVSASKPFTVSGQNLQGPVALRVTGNFEISTTGATYSPALDLNPAGGAGSLPSTTIYARMKSGAPAGTARGSVAATGLNAVDRSVALNGVVFAAAGEAETFVRTLIEKYLLIRPEDPPNWRGSYGYGDKLTSLLSFYQSRLTAGIAPNQAKAEAMMRLTGFNESSRQFDPNDPFQEVRHAYTPYAALGLAPDAASIESFVRTMRTGRRDLLPVLAHVPSPNTGVSFNGLRNAPWSATYGMADAMRNLFSSSAFRSAHPSVAALSSRNFYDWMQNTMFPGRSMGKDGSATLLAMLDDMSFDPLVGRAFAQAAAASFRVVYASMLLTESSSGSNGSDVEAPFQRRLGRAALEHMLWGKWAYSASSPELDAAGVTALMRVPVIGTNQLPTLKAGSAFGGFQIPASAEVTYFRASGLPAWLQLEESSGLIRLRAGESAVPAHNTTTNYTFALTAGHLLAETTATMSVKVDPAPVQAGKFSTWLAAHRLEGSDVLGTTDADGDGLRLLEEYAYGGNPASPSENPVRQSRAGQEIVLQWTGLAAKAYRIQSSTDLVAGWNERPDIRVVAEGTAFARAGVSYQALRAQVKPVSGGVEFFRVVANFDAAELK